MPVEKEVPDIAEAAKPRLPHAEPPVEQDIFLPAFSAHPQGAVVPSGIRRPTRINRGFAAWAAEGLHRLRHLVPAMIREEAAHGHGFLFVPIAIGAGAAFWFCLPKDPLLSPLALAFVFFAAVALATRYRPSPWSIASLALALFLGGMMLAQFETWRRSTVILDSPVTTMITGRVERLEPDGQGRWRYIVRLAATADPVLRRPPEKVSLLARSRHEPIASGETITGRARLSPPSGPALPGLVDFAFSAYFDDIGAVGFFYGAPKRAEPAGQDDAPWLDEMERKLFDLRSMIASRIRAVVPGDAGAFAAAIVTDERRAISKETTEALRVLGLAHIVAISGLNMALAAGIFFVGVRMVLGLFMGFAQAWPVKKIAAFGALLMATAYYLISGFAVSAERAYLMMAVMLVAVLFDRAAISLRNVALSALVIIAISPSEIMGPSFQMSFSATVALVAGYALWKRRAAGREPEIFPLRHRAVTPLLTGWNFIAGIFATSLIGGLSTAIYSIEHFHRIATYGLAANLAAMPIISFLVMPMGLIGMLLMPFGLEEFFLKLMGLGLEAVIAVARHVASWGGDIGAGRQHPWFMPVATIGFLFLTLLRTRLRLMGLPIFAAAVLLSVLGRPAAPPDLLIAEDGTMAALTEAGRTATNRTRPPSFIFSQWHRALLLEPPESPALSLIGDKAATPSAEAAKRRDLTPEEVASARERLRNALVSASAARFTCEPKAWCAAKTSQAAGIVMVEDWRLTGVACDVAAIVIAPRARFDHCRSGALLFNGKTLRRTGALEIEFNGSGDPSLWSFRAAMDGKNRPWSRHRHYDWRSGDYDAALPEPLAKLISGSGG